MTRTRHAPPSRVVRVPNRLLLSDQHLWRAHLIAQGQPVALSELVRTTSSNLHDALGRARLVSTDAAREYEGLYDELSSYVTPVPPPPFARLAEKASREFSVFASTIKDGPTIRADRFPDFLIEIHRRLGKGRTTFRKSGIQIAPDGNNVVTVFPDWRECEYLLGELGTFIEANIATRPLLTATVGYVGVVHAHPFSDGNGRTARVLYNCILGASGSAHFLPIKSIAELVDGAFLVKIRRAFLGGDWAGLQAFFRDALVLSDRLQRAAS